MNIYEENKAKGFWDLREGVPDKMEKSGLFTKEELDFVKGAIRDQMLLLIVGEISEGVEACRKGRFASNVEEVTYALDSGNDSEFKRLFELHIKDTLEDEAADWEIRSSDFCQGTGIDVEKHKELKLAYNKLRPHKHGKKY